VFNPIQKIAVGPRQQLFLVSSCNGTHDLIYVPRLINVFGNWGLTCMKRSYILIISIVTYTPEINVFLWEITGEFMIIVIMYA
jgi:hypothetical protein